jgi:hypothetical protein
VLAVLAGLLVTGAIGGSQPPPADQQACKYFSIWIQDGGANQNFGGYTSLLDQAETSALRAASPEARAAINRGAFNVPDGLQGKLARDISFVQGDAEGDLNPPIGWGDEVASVQTDCAGL